MSNRRWDAIEYQRMTAVSSGTKEITVEFENNDVVTINKSQINPKEMKEEIWDTVQIEPGENIITSSAGDIQIPWTTIRLFTDEEFAEYWVRTAEDQAKEIGIKIRRLRKARNLTSKEVALRSGISPQSLSRIENGHHDVVFTTLRKILASMGCTLSDLTSIDDNILSFKELTKKLEAAGINKELLVNRILPEDVIAMVAEQQPVAVDDALEDIANYLSKIFKWPSDQVLSSQPLHLDQTVAEAGMYKIPAQANFKNTVAYVFYAHYLALLGLQATGHLEYHHPPDDPKIIRKAIIRTYGAVNLENTLRYIWGLGIPVIPLFDAGAFHGACWYESDRSVIILKQRTKYQGRWLFDLCHELGHVAKHMSKDNPNIIEYMEISPFHKYDEEWEASQFANQIMFDDKADKLAQMCVEMAKNKLENLKSAVVQVSTSENVGVDILANYLAFRLSDENNINWWGTANNLQITNPHPRQISKSLLEKNIRPESLVKEDYELLSRAMAD